MKALTRRLFGVGAWDGGRNGRARRARGTTRLPRSLALLFSLALASVIVSPLDVLGAPAGPAPGQTGAATTAAPAASPTAAPAVGNRAGISAPPKTSVEACSVPADPNLMRCFAQARTDPAANGRRPDQVRTLDDNTPALGNNGAYSPVYLQSAYNLTSASATNGSNMLVAIVDAFDAPTAEVDLGVYRSFWGLPACTTANGCFRKVNQSGVQGSYPVPNAGWAEEIALDVDMVSAICPNCRILLVEANSNSSLDLMAAVNTAANLGANVISNSYGHAERTTDIDLLAGYNHPGIAITVSSGDSGFGAQFPAASPDVIAVGGTSLNQITATGTRNATETAWSGAGSGCTLRLKPSWQTDPACNARTVADVSAVADPNTGVWVYTPTTIGGAAAWHIFGGTSASAPIIGAVYALAGAQSVNAASALYAHSGNFFDITSGTNGVCGTYLCNGVLGYDGPTGLGTPNGTAGFSPVVNCTPVRAAITSPTPGTTLTTNSQTFSWSTGTCAREYWLYAGTTQGSSNVLDSGSLGTSTSRNVTGLPSSGTLWLRLWTRFDAGWQSSDFSYTLSGPPPPPRATLISPAGAITNATPTFSWAAAGSGPSLATWYYLWLDGPSGTVLTQWYTATSAGCAAGGICSLTPSLTLGGGNYTWWIQGWNPAGYGLFSSGLNFSEPIPPPPNPPATLISPSGALSNGSPAFTWTPAGSGASLATWYYLWIDGPTGNVLNQWYSATAAGCRTGGTCSIAPGLNLAGGGYTWWIQGWNPGGGYGRWSSGMSFSTPLVSWFTPFSSGTLEGWQAITGFWEPVAGFWLHTPGLPQTGASARHTGDFANYDYEVVLWRYGCDTCANRIMLRGGEFPLHSTNWWDHAYVFQYSRDGSYSIYKSQNGTETALQNWTFTSAINEFSAWNDLRVAVRGSTMFFYINTVLVWYGADSSVTGNDVGMGMFSDGNSGDALWSDWASFTAFNTSAAAAIKPVLSEEQQTLNSAARAATTQFNRDAAPANQRPASVSVSPGKVNDRKSLAPPHP